MEEDFDVKFINSELIKVTDQKTGDSAVFQYYDDDPELYLVSIHYEQAGIPLSMLEDFFDAADEQISIERYMAEEAASVSNRLRREFEIFHEEVPDWQKKSKEEVIEFFHNRDVRILNESPADFFLPLDMNKMLPDTTEEETATQFYQSEAEADPKELIPESMRKQVEALYKTKYSFRLGYPAMLLEEPCDKTELAFYPDSQSGILFLDRTHICGIIQFSNLKKNFADNWNIWRPRFPQLYCSESGKMLLVKKYELNEKDEIIDSKMSDWYSFFNTFPNLIIREYQEFKQKHEAVRRHR